ncbi:MAG TPA: hypothetical protein VLZ10_19835 [Thermodesulfobacteriota bacterium]|nr:hypothetical protein [Thermodesulfobacteriota bacterium]
MSNYLTRSKSTAVLGILALVCVTLALAGPAAAQCKQYKLELPDLDTLNLKDGEHVVGAVETLRGKLEARVTVKDKVVSDPILFIGGTRMTEVPESQIPKSVLGCMKAELPSGIWLANAADYILDWITPPAYAKACKRWVIRSGCDDKICCAVACCASSGACATWCQKI